MPHSIAQTENALQALEKDLGELQDVLHQNNTTDEHSACLAQNTEVLQGFTDLNIDHLYIA